jgi:hypothetical protein
MKPRDFRACWIAFSFSTRKRGKSAQDISLNLATATIDITSSPSVKPNTADHRELRDGLLPSYPFAIRQQKAKR